MLNTDTDIDRKTPKRANMEFINGGTFMMGSNKFYPEEKPTHKVTVNGFWIDKCLVTNKEYSDFVSATNYVTVAERPLNPAEFPAVAKVDLVPGSMVFEKRNGPVDLNNYANWWRWIKGANWKHPQGPDSSINGLDNHPVVQIAYEDAEAYAKWAGKDLPTEGSLHQEVD
jgi:formylglycine-generating enzyme required for sulfatase activity